ncbi:MAG TPA: ABC transporter ATP-binding protein, partial [Ilumatobacteraceae bacterium]|nr:ABC transporter ATP-binding protein [Ilumatobacteraceae bacterium]
VIVGPSGCGKTTLLRMIAGLEDVTSGDVLVDGVRINDVPPNRRDIAMAFQSYALYPHMTVAENIGFPLRIDGVHATTLDRQVRKVARTLQIDDVLDRTPSHLSGGQQQRAALARAVIREPRLLLMDEPMSNLDAKLRSQTRIVICGIQRRLALTTVHVTHDQDEAMSMGDRLAVMNGGRIVQHGRPIDVYEAPDNLFVAQFVGAPAMNVIAATFVVDGGTSALRIGCQHVPLDDETLQRLPALAELDGRDVALGIRADALRPDAGGPLALSVMATEQIDQRKYVFADVDAPSITYSDNRVVVDGGHESSLVLSVDPNTPVSLWESFHASIDLSRIHLFDLTTGSRLGVSRANRP